MSAVLAPLFSELRGNQRTTTYPDVPPMYRHFRPPPVWHGISSSPNAWTWPTRPRLRRRAGYPCRVSRRPAEQLSKRKGGGVGCEGVPWRILMAAGAEHQTVERRPQTGRRSPRAVAGHRVLGSTGKRRAHRLPKQPPITPTREHSFGSREACDAL